MDEVFESIMRGGDRGLVRISLADQVHPSHVVGQDEENVGVFPRFGSGSESDGEEQDKPDPCDRIHGSFLFACFMMTQSIAHGLDLFDRCGV